VTRTTVRHRFSFTSSGDSAVRIDLPSTEPAPAVAVTPKPREPGEYWLHGHVARLLSRGAPGRSLSVLADVVVALLAAGALSPLSQLPGQVARLCERHGVGHHGIAAPPARDEDLPEPWRGTASGQPTVIAPARITPARIAPARPDGYAAVALALPDLSAGDGGRLTLLGLANTAAQTILHVHVTGAQLDLDDDSLPVLWLRDDRGCWHATAPHGWSTHDGRSIVRLEVMPALNNAAAVELLAIGRTAEARATVPLRWR
jgi:hypothetical protein